MNTPTEQETLETLVAPTEHNQAATPEQPPATNPSGSGAAREKLTISSSLGQLAEPLSEAEEAEYFACEQVVGTGWQNFVQVGLALARIRDGRLYRIDFNTFEDYCRMKWEYGRHYVNHLISAAQVFTHLVTIGHQN